MSRHRNVRSMNYNDEYDGYDDVYGHSVEDDYSISPSVAGFMYDRSKQPDQSVYMNEKNNIAEEDEYLAEEPNLEELSDLDRAKMVSCVEEIQNVIGDSVPLSTVQKIVVKYDFHLKRALDAILNENETVETPPVEDDSKFLPRLHSKDLKQDFQNTPIIVESPGKVLAAKTTNITKGFDLGGLRSQSPHSESHSRNHSRCASPASNRLQLQEPKSRNQSRCGSPASGRTSPDSDRRSDTPSSKSKPKVDVEAAYTADRGSSKAQLHMVVIGHVDAGKSTLMGHLLHDLGQVNQRTMHKYEQESKKIGKQSFVYAWILDETGEERSRGITMDVGHNRFETTTKSVYLLDAPGHRDFIPNMISGAAQADVAVMVVDATRGEFETGFEMGGQTREHALLVRALGVSQLAVVVNKLDTVNWSEERFKEITSKLGPFLKQAGFRETDVTYIPCSGLAGENLVKPCTKQELTSWYKGPTLLEVIDSFKAPERPISKPLRMSISDIYKGTGSGHCIAGRLETGMLQSGDKVVILPQNEVTQAKVIQIDEMPVPCAYAGDSISVTLALSDPSSLTIGSILCDPGSPVPVVTSFEARIVVFNIAVPITIGFQVVLHAHAVSEQANIIGLVALLNKSTGEVVKKKPRCLTKNSNAIVRIQTSRPICLELNKDIKELGRVMLRVNGVSIAAGVVIKLI